MGKKNYSKISNEKPQTDVVETTETVVENEIVISETDVPVEQETKPVIGVVTGCTRLNVRTKPNKNSDVEIVIPKGTEVEILNPESNGDFYNVEHHSSKMGFVGYCMKKFIEIK